MSVTSLAIIQRLKAAIAMILFALCHCSCRLVVVPAMSTQRGCLLRRFPRTKDLQQPSSKRLIRKRGNSWHATCISSTQRTIFSATLRLKTLIQGSSLSDAVCGRLCSWGLDIPSHPNDGHESCGVLNCCVRRWPVLVLSPCVSC